MRLPLDIDLKGGGVLKRKRMKELGLRFDKHRQERKLPSWNKVKDKEEEREEGRGDWGMLYINRFKVDCQCIVQRVENLFAIFHLFLLELLQWRRKHNLNKLKPVPICSFVFYYSESGQWWGHIRAGGALWICNALTFKAKGGKSPCRRMNFWLASMELIRWSDWTLLISSFYSSFPR